MAYKPWHERFVARFIEECEGMRARGFALDESVFRSERRVQYLGKSLIRDDLTLTIKYPDSFPSKPPRVYSSPEEPLLRRHHKPENREICTFGPGQGRWRANLSGTDAIDEAENVIATTSFPASGEGQEPDNVPEPVTANYIYLSHTCILIPPQIASHGASLGVGQSLPFKLLFRNWPGDASARGGRGRGVLTTLGEGNQVVRTLPVYLNYAQGGFDLKGRLFRIAEPPPATNQKEFSQWLRQLEGHEQKWLAFIFPEQAGNAITTRLTWLTVRHANHDQFEPLRTFVLDGSGRNVRMPGLSSLPNKKAVFIGCGSVGSKIACNLAAAGVGRFGLIDCEILEPDNAVRHEVGVDWFGVHKTQALEQRIIQLNPEASNNIQISDILVGGINPAEKEAQFQDMLASASIVVDTTGDHGVSRYINDLCGQFRVPQIYASITNGAWAGEAIRVIPSQTACWMCWFNQYEDRRAPAEPAPATGIYAPGCDQPTFTGTSYDIAIVAGLASSLAIDTLLYQEPNRKRYGGDYIRWQMRDQNGEVAPRVDVLPVDKRTTCAFCETA